MNRHAQIIGTGSYVPEKLLTNADLSRLLGEDIDAFVAGKIGIRERHICAPDESTADLAVFAAFAALDAAGVQPAELDLLIVATDTPEYLSPATSSVVQDRLGAYNAGTFDVNCACAGFVTALDTAVKYIATDEQYRTVLVIGAYAMSKFLDWTDKKTCTLFADGAGAVVLQASATPGFLASSLAADGRYHRAMGIYAGGTHLPINEQVLAEGRQNKVRFVERVPPEFNAEQWPRLIQKTLAKARLALDDVQHFFLTQINLGTITEVMQRLAQPLSKSHHIMHKWGYTGSACLPMALDNAVKQGKLQPGEIIVFCGSGGGVAMGCLAFRWQ
ncbi:MAG: ketoacyl-ACP synthase III [Acidobacteria bacterium]|nr:ketoacyl-ACP synthase III [Acidobacteriota bacterium]